MTTEATILDLLIELEALSAAGYPDDNDEAACQAIYDRKWKVREEIDASPARNLAELRAKARAAEVELERDPECECSGQGSFVSLAQSIFRDIAALAAAAGAKAEA
jgi:hypothetical protein